MLIKKERQLKRNEILTGIYRVLPSSGITKVLECSAINEFVAFVNFSNCSDKLNCGL